MTFETIDGLFTISTNAIMTLALAGVMLLVGYFMKSKISFFEKYCIPAPVIGGFLFMFITLAGYMTNSFNFSFDTYFQDPFMLAFFTTVGLGASYKLLMKGGVLLFIYWAVACIVSIFQNVIGIGVGMLVGLEAPYALLSSAISMIGGHGAAATYGKSFVEMGYPQGELVGAAAATFGLISAVLVGGPLGRALIERHGLKPEDAEIGNAQHEVQDVNVAKGGPLTGLDIIKNFVAITVCMALGQTLATIVGNIIGMWFPSYVCAMFVAVIIRNVNDVYKFYRFDYPLVEGIGDVALALYLSMAMITLELWELASLIGGVMIVVLSQVIFVSLLAYFVIFRILGKNYDAAVMCAGLCGHGLGATPSAIVNMTAVTDRYGMSYRAFLIVPIVGAFLVDLVYQPQTLWFIASFVENLTGFVG